MMIQYNITLRPEVISLVYPRPVSLFFLGDDFWNEKLTKQNLNVYKWWTRKGFKRLEAVQIPFMKLYNTVNKLSMYYYIK